MTTDTLPSLQGHADEWRDGRYRLFTRDYGTYAELRARFSGATVAMYGWSVSYGSLAGFLSSRAVVERENAEHGDFRYTLNLSTHENPLAESVKHPLNGTRYRSTDEATEAAFDVGALAFMVYEKDRP